mmetsp:Transcript_32986/g.60418  ORF Transcript_32986/g.60418 Transcript_32986/m.60418 type:complete len:113 (+) Transcript_32986:1231-1569(+)
MEPGGIPGMEPRGGRIPGMDPIGGGMPGMEPIGGGIPGMEPIGGGIPGCIGPGGPLPKLGREPNPAHGANDPASGPPPNAGFPAGPGKATDAMGGPGAIGGGIAAIWTPPLF